MIAFSRSRLSSNNVLINKTVQILHRCVISYVVMGLKSNIKINSLRVNVQMKRWIIYLKMEECVTHEDYFSVELLWANKISTDFLLGFGFIF